MRSVVYSSPWVPAEWIAAHGFQPRRVLPAAAHHVHAGACPFAESFLQTPVPEETAAIVYTATCDQMRRAAEVRLDGGPPPVFLLQVPAACESAGALDYYVAELRRLGRFLVRLGAQPPEASRLLADMHDRETRRTTLRASRERRSARQFAESILALNGSNPLLPLDDGGSQRTAGIPLAVVGESYLAEQLTLLDSLEAMGGRVVLDATANGERSWPALFKLDATGDPLAALARAYLEGIPEAFRRPNQSLYTWLIHGCRERQVRGIILRYYVWCDLWHAEVHRMKSELPVPVLDLECGSELELTAHHRSRLQAFLEMLT